MDRRKFFSFLVAAPLASKAICEAIGNTDIPVEGKVVQEYNGDKIFNGPGLRFDAIQSQGTWTPMGPNNGK